jgi:chorismate mutase
VSIAVNNEGSTPRTAPAPDIPAVDISAVDIPAVDISALREEIDSLDGQILELIKRRSEVSQRIGAIRRAEGGPRIVLSREQAVLARFRDLGPEGRELGMLLLRLGRGRLGRS